MIKIVFKWETNAFILGAVYNFVEICIARETCVDHTARQKPAWARLLVSLDEQKK